MKDLEKSKIALIGLGYVGLPLAVEFGKKYPTVGFDINKERVEELLRSHDRTLEVADEELKEVIVKNPIQLRNQRTGLYCTDAVTDISECNIYIVTVPTPTDEHNRPVLTPLTKSSETVGNVLSKGDVVIYESTVYPGVTEDHCVPILEKVSGLKYNEDFFVGYSPERINPGDKLHTVTKILKVTSGSTPEVADYVDALYRSVIVAGTFKASGLKVAEAAKVIENSQRDINIAFVNELAKIFNLMGIDTHEVLEAAGTKWNFLPFKPGLVGGHCIGVDPYYLTHKAEELGHHPDVILAGRRINDRMGEYVVSRLVKTMLNKQIMVNGAKILLLGITFKENCPDIRNTKVVDIAHELESYHVKLDIYDPWAESEEVEHEYGLTLVDKPVAGQYDAVIGAVAHSQFKEWSNEELRGLCKPNAVIFDLKYMFDKDAVDIRL